MQFSSAGSVIPRLLKRGYFSDVYECFDAAHVDAPYVVKVTCSRVTNTQVAREVNILAHLHELSCVVHLVQPASYADLGFDRRRTIVMEHCGADLFYYMTRTEPVRTPTSYMTLAHTLCLAVAEVHAKGVCHLDIKAENVAYDPRTGKMTLLDFGLADWYVPGRRLGRRCGSLEYMAPEMLSNRNYDGKLADAWSLGVLLFLLVAANLFPFAQAKESDVNFRNVACLQSHYGTSATTAACLLHGARMEVDKVPCEYLDALDVLLRIDETQRGQVLDALERLNKDEPQSKNPPLAEAA